ncbi:addiction module protein [Agrococcus sp. KRD186]|jgi:hypothetical protein|uniref:addiction module protein n=1 Tax=Agrococcus sp. KRD186 TaxID=2729730 RepID=UPI0019D046BF|nr:addiction module protein [Agrococcus sp. KRD186]
MGLDKAEIERGLLSLAPADRAIIIERGLLSLEDIDDVPQAEIDEAWRIEIERRVDEYVNGDAQLVDADERFAQRRARLAARVV